MGMPAVTLRRSLDATQDSWRVYYGACTGSRATISLRSSANLKSREEVQMKVALLAVLGAQLTTPASGRVPELKVEALCKARSADAKLMRIAETQSVAECVSDENDAKQELNTIWGSTSQSILNQCESDGIVLGTRGYLDLLSCIEIADDTKSVSTAAVSGATRIKKGRRH
jgi:hypothetical protein